MYFEAEAKQVYSRNKLARLALFIFSNWKYGKLQFILKTIHKCSFQTGIEIFDTDINV